MRSVLSKNNQFQEELMKISIYCFKCQLNSSREIYSKTKNIDRRSFCNSTEIMKLDETIN